MSMPVRATFVFGSVAIAYASAAGLNEPAASGGSGGASCSSKTAVVGSFFVSTTFLFARARTLRAVGMGGGRTGARGRVGMLVRCTTGGGGLEVAGCPSASKNLRMRSSSDSTGARLIG